MPTFRIGEWLLEAPAIYRVPKLEGDFLAPIPPGSQPLIDFDGQGDEWIGENNLNRIHVVVSMCSV